MYRQAIRLLLERSYRYDDRQPALAGRYAKPPILRRRTTLLLAFIVIGSVFYGSLIPFKIDTTRHFTFQLIWHKPASGDFAANVLIYVPIGVLLRLIFRRRGSNAITECASALLLAGIISYITEVCQTVIVYRVPSWTDALCNLTGTTIGIVGATHWQRMVRNVHAWLFNAIRKKPFAAAAAAATVCLWTYALTPFDIYPAPGRVMASLHAIVHADSWFPFGLGRGGDTQVSYAQAVDKVVAATSYSLLAFLLVFAIREAGGSVARGVWYGLSRSIAMATAIEGVQLFTISHVADPADWTGAIISVIAGGLSAAALLTWQPRLHERPLAVLRRIAAIVAGTLLLWGCLVAYFRAQDGYTEFELWLPGFATFHLYWNTVLGLYAKDLLQYVLIGMVVSTWYRVRERRPREEVVILWVFGALLINVSLLIWCAQPVDTTKFLLAMLAVVATVRIDRAFFGRPRGVSPWVRLWCRSEPGTSPRERRELLEGYWEKPTPDSTAAPEAC